MTTRPKPTLAAALNVAAGKPAVEPAAVAGRPARTTQVAPVRIGKKAVCGHFDQAVGRQLRQLGLDHDKSVQALLGEALNLLFEKYGKLPIA